MIIDRIHSVILASLSAFLSRYITVRWYALKSDSLPDAYFAQYTTQKWGFTTLKRMQYRSCISECGHLVSFKVGVVNNFTGFRNSVLSVAPSGPV